MTPTFENLAVSANSYEMARRPLDPDQCALVVVDIQEKLLPPIWEKDRLIRNTQLLIRLASILKIPALVTTQYTKGLGNTVPGNRDATPRHSGHRQTDVLLLR